MIQIRINERVFIKDPETSSLGRRIVEHSIVMIDEIGIEHFTFKKLAQRINSTEASIYRYFENKHKLLIYLVSWYWNWLEYQLIFQTNNISNAKERLEIALRVVSQPHLMQTGFVEKDKYALHRIVVAESPKAYLSKEVDADNKEGYFLSYKRLCGYMAEIVKEINPEYGYPRALISTLIESAHNQRFFADHLPRLTDVNKGSDEEVTEFLLDMALRVLRMQS
ncbi:MAG: TetR/AcrR family transcriptional regulator [Bacteroidota bacterium]